MVVAFNEATIAAQSSAPASRGKGCGMRFLAIYSPGEFKTTWVDQTSTWILTAFNISGSRGGGFEL